MKCKAKKKRLYTYGQVIDLLIQNNNLIFGSNDDDNISVYWDYGFQGEGIYSNLDAFLTMEYMYSAKYMEIDNKEFEKRTKIVEKTHDVRKKIKDNHKILQCNKCGSKYLFYFKDGFRVRCNMCGETYGHYIKKWVMLK